LRTIAAKHSDQPGYQHLMRMQDSFQISGPNETHECLVLELLGPSVADILDEHSGIERLPGTLAKIIAKQTLLGLCFLQEQKITHAGILTCQHSFDLLLTTLRSTYPQPGICDPCGASLARRGIPPEALTARNRKCSKKRRPATRAWCTPIPC
jgi:hypothetical protein